MSGVIGVFGKNFSGKSSIIDALLYTVFNSTSKNERKNLNVINQNREYGSGKLQIDIGEELAREMKEEGGQLAVINELISQCLRRDEGWKQYYKEVMSKLEEIYGRDNRAAPTGL